MKSVTFKPEPLVLLPGMMCDARLYGPQLSTLGAEREVHIPAYANVSSIGSIVEQLLKELPKRFALAGLSMGGIVAMELIRIAPERVTRLALLDTNPRSELVEVQQGREAQIEAVMAGELADVMSSQMICRYLSDKAPNADEIETLCLQMALDLGNEAFISQSRALQSRPDQQESLPQVKVPTLILMGREDQLCPLDRHQRMLELIPGARFVEIASAGHLPTLEQPELTNKALKEWLER